MTPEVLLKAYVLHQSEDGFVELVASTLDEVYARALRIIQSPPHLVEETVLRVYWDLAKKPPRLNQLALGAWLREHTCRTAVKILREANRAVDRGVLKAERQGVSSGMIQAAPAGLTTRVTQSILLNRASRKSFWSSLPWVIWPAWARPVHIWSGIACALTVLILWRVPFHKRNHIVFSPESRMTPASYGQLASPDETAVIPPPPLTPSSNE